LCVFFIFVRLKTIYWLFADCHEDPQFMLRSHRGGAGQNECKSTELSVCSRGETAISLYQQHGEFKLFVWGWVATKRRM
jgi:hypothetical protein